MRSIYIFLGPPGAGKGTQAKIFSSKLGIAHISTGDMLRAAMQAGTELGNRVKSIVDSGSLVSDELMIAMIEGRIAEADCRKGFVLDGFPRTVPQAEALEVLLGTTNERVSSAVLFDIDQEVLLQRLCNRRSEENRADDNEETQRKRLDVYNKQTAPLIEYYTEKNNLKVVDSNGTMDQVSERLFKI